MSRSGLIDGPEDLERYSKEYLTCKQVPRLRLCRKHEQRSIKGYKRNSLVAPKWLAQLPDSLSVQESESEIYTSTCHVGEDEWSILYRFYDAEYEVTEGEYEDIEVEIVKLEAGPMLPDEWEPLLPHAAGVDPVFLAGLPCVMERSTLIQRIVVHLTKKFAKMNAELPPILPAVKNRHIKPARHPENWLVLTEHGGILRVAKVIGGTLREIFALSAKREAGVKQAPLIRGENLADGLAQLEEFMAWVDASIDVKSCSHCGGHGFA